MSFLGGGSDDSASREMIQMQKDEAAAARAKEVKRQADITSGLARIKEAFHGKEGKVRKTYDWKGFDPATAKAGAVPGMAGYSFVKQAATPGTPAVYGPSPTSFVRRGRDDTGSGQQLAPGTGTGTGGPTQGPLVTPAVAATPGGWVIKGPDGKLYKMGDVVSGDIGTGQFSGGIQDSFFDNFKKGILDFYQPQVAEKYQKARDETTYRLADAGTLRSTMANEAVADLAKQNILNTADVRSKADTAAADLRTRTANEEAKATSQLFATENPDVAANQATSAVTNLIAEKPTSTPLGDIFSLAAVGGAKFLQGADNAAFSKRVGALPKPATYVRN